MKNLKNISLCNTPVIPNEKGRSLLQPSPGTSPQISTVLRVPKDNAGENILVTFFLITKTLQMYVFF